MYLLFYPLPPQRRGNVDEIPRFIPLSGTSLGMIFTFRIHPVFTGVLRVKIKICSQCWPQDERKIARRDAISLSVTNTENRLFWDFFRFLSRTAEYKPTGFLCQERAGLRQIRPSFTIHPS